MSVEEAMSLIKTHILDNQYRMDLKVNFYLLEEALEILEESLYDKSRKY